MFGLTKLIPGMYLWIVAAVAFAGWSGYMEHHGYVRSEAKNAVVRAKEVAAAQKIYMKEVARGEALSQRLAKQEVVISYRTKEKIKYVYQATTNRPCLSGDVVRVLNNSTDPDKTAPPSRPVTEDATPVASDTDVAGWIVEAQGLYTTCATRLNSLIDYVDPRSQPAVE